MNIYKYLSKMYAIVTYEEAEAPNIYYLHDD
jgi:hypothetical protein